MAVSCIWPELMTWILAKWTQLEAGDRYRYLDTSWQHFILDTDNDPLELYVSDLVCLSVSTPQWETVYVLIALGPSILSQKLVFISCIFRYRLIYNCFWLQLPITNHAR